MNTVAHTSKAAYSQHVSSGNKQKQLEHVIDKIKQHVLSCDYQTQGGLSRRQISVITGIELGAVAGRVNKLVKLDLLIEHGKIKDLLTNRMVGLVRLPYCSRGDV